MRAFIASVMSVLVLTLFGGLVFVYSGLYNVGATDPHWPVTRWVLETVRTRSIEAHAPSILAPPGLDDRAKLLIGTSHFAEHCAVCHGAPGVPRGEIGQGLNPQPPDLSQVSNHYTPSQLFWILKHGIRMTGMPSWGDHGDDELWAIVAFLENLPGISAQDYAKLVAASVMANGGHHDHAGDHQSDSHPQ